MKCPACAFESPDEAEWCDFCKEPFRKKAASPPPPTAAKPTPAAPAFDAATLSSPRKAEKNGSLPPEFAHLDPGERIPILPPWVRLAAWGLLTFWFVAAMVVFGYYFGKKAAQEPPSSQTSAD
jgi:hypothetical protein